jgi:hypothetical protein
MESVRASAFSSIANKDYLKANILTPPSTVEAAARAPLHTLKEQVAVGIYQDIATAPIILLSDPQHPIPQVLSENGKLADATVNPKGLLQVDLLLQWTSANGRTRTRQLSSIFGRGNIGP